MARVGVRMVGGAALMLALACSDEHPVDDPAQPAQPALTAATYNLGLLELVGAVDERAPHAIDATVQLDAELVCVQEVWEQPHWDALVAAHAAKRPNVLRLPADPGALGQCVPDQFNPLQACAMAKCAQSDGLATCAAANCGPQVAALDSGCQACLLGNAGSGDFDAIRAACVGNPAAGAAGRSYISGGSYGIGLLSSRPFVVTDQLLLDASTVRRGILYARVADANLGDVHVFCTHLSAIQTGLKYDGSYGDWDGENGAHVDALINYVNSKAGANGKVLILGDLNTGPAAPGISPSVPANYAKFAPAGFANPYLSGPMPACTFCADNPLVMSADGAAGALIDHVLTRKLDNKVSVTRVLDGRIEIDMMQPGGGTMKRTVALSDHYGLRAVVTR